MRYRLRGMNTITKQIQISRRTERISNPRHKKQRTLEDKVFPMFRDTEPIEQSLQGIAGEKKLVVGFFRKRRLEAAFELSDL